MSQPRPAEGVPNCRDPLGAATAAMPPEGAERTCPGTLQSLDSGIAEHRDTWQMNLSQAVPGKAPSRPQVLSRHLATAACVMLLSGCNVAIVVTPDLPAPLVERLPLRAAVHLSREFLEFEHQEKDVGGRDWTVGLGTANDRLVATLATALFASSKRVSGVAEAATEMPELDLILVPTVEKFEFSVPSQSATDQYAVWIRYNLDLHDAAGNAITTWSVSAYGQSGQDGFGATEPLQRAVVRAVRDALATIATGFAKQKRIREALLREPVNDAG